MTGSKKHLTESQKGAILYGYNAGHSFRAIGREVGCSHSTVADFIYRSFAPETFPQKNPKGRPPIFDSPARERLRTLVSDGNRALSLEALAIKWEEQEGQAVSERTIRKNLHKIGLRSCVALQKPYISLENQQKRLDWALLYRNWTISKWKRVLWTDEKIFTQFLSKSKSRVWRTSDEKFDTECLAPKVAHSPSRMFWGCFSSKGTGPLVPLFGRVTGQAHKITLQKHALPTLKRHFPKHNGILQEDNARVHTSKIPRNFLASKGVELLPWPANSPDLNPIENLWSIVEQKVHKRKPPPSSLTQLERMVKEEWRAIDRDVIHNLIESMPRRIEAVIEANGGPTKY
jgi:transposase